MSAQLRNFLAALLLAATAVFSHTLSAQEARPGNHVEPAAAPATVPGVNGPVTPTVVSPVITGGHQAPAPEAAPRPSEAAKAPIPPEETERPEFQEFVSRSVGKLLQIYGQQLFSGVPTTFAPVDRVPVPADYVIGPGDEILIRAWGQVEIDVRAIVDRNGTINIPKVGVINLTGIRNQELGPYLKTQISRVFRNFDLNATLGNLRSIQVFVVGNARRPGSYTVSSLSTLVNTLFSAGGPSVKGSMRAIQLKRGNQVVTEFDFYDLLLKGDKSKDAQLMPGDVIYIPPVGPMAAISGSVNQPAIYELRGESSFQDLLNLAGGLTPTALADRVQVERIDARMVRKVDEFKFDQAGLAKRVRDGDLVQVFAIQPRFDNAVTLRGSVAEPARFPWREGMRVRDVIPSRDALIVPEYWLRQNLATRVEVDSQGRLRTQLKRSLPEVNWDYAVIERLRYDDLTTTLIPFHLGRAVLEGDPTHNILLQSGDVITIFSKDDISVPIAKRTKYILLEGEFMVPGVYQVMPGETLRQLLARVGGFSPNAYLYGAEFFRESTRVFQQRVLDDSIDRLEEEIQRNAATIAQQSVTPDEANSLRVQAMAQQSLVAKLRRAKATGRIVLEMPTDGSAPKDVPEIVLEDGDRLHIPYQPSVVSVVGSVFSANAFVYKPAFRVDDYVALAGGPTKDADEGSIYVVRADGTVMSAQQSGWILGTISGKAMMPGDAVVVPEKLDKYKLTRTMKDIAQIFYQMALGVAGLKVLKDL